MFHMRERYHLVGQHVDDAKPLVIGTFDTSEEAEQAVLAASTQDPDNNWKFYVEPVKDLLPPGN